MNRRIAIVTRARAPYHRALLEAFAEEVGAAGGEVRLIYPRGSASAFADSATVPQGKHLSVVWLETETISAAAKGYGTRWRSEASGTQLPSWRLRHELDLFDPALVWIHEYSPYTLGALLWAKWRGRPVVVSSEVGLANEHFFPWQVRLWHRLWSHLADGIIACSPAALRPSCGEERPVVAAYHAADSRRLLPSLRSIEPGAPIQFVQVGRILPRKGADLLLAALAQLNAEGHRNWRLRLLGPDTDGWGVGHITRLGLESQVEIAGHLDGDALWQAFGQADAFVLATRQDTYAAVVHEAACLGLPLLVSRHAGAAEALVQEEKNGFTFLPEDTATFTACLRAAMNPTALMTMSLHSRAIAEVTSAHVRARAVWTWMGQHFSL
jgi:glycosyltransferase involved in cell wall biosynthesis